MAVKTFYQSSGMVSNVFQQMSESSPGADGTSSPNYGWTVGTTAPGNYASSDAQSMVAAASFGPTEPTALVTTQAAGNGGRTGVPFDGTHDAGTWTFIKSIIETGAGVGAKGKCHWRLFRSKNSNGSGNTEITTAAVVGNEVAIGISQTNCTGTVSLPTFTLENEYLFLMEVWEVTALAGGKSASTCGVVTRVGTTASRMVTTNFTQTPGVTEWKESTSTVTVATSDTAWLVPANAQSADGAVAQFVNTNGLVDQTSQYLFASVFGLGSGDLSDAAKITGIETSIDHNALTAATNISFLSWQLVINGVATGTDQSDGAFFPTTMTIKTKGGVGNTLGASGLTGADVKLTNSGFQIQALGSGVGGDTGRVDQMAWRVRFQTSGGASQAQLLIGNL